MVGQQQLFSVERLNRIEKSFKVLCTVDVGHRVTNLLHHLRQCRRPHAVFAAPEINQN